MDGNNVTDNLKIEFGDFQTPEFFTDKVCNYLKSYIKIKPTVILEPTCGVGNFLISALNVFSAKKNYGIEINNNYYNEAKSRLNNKVELFNCNLFTFDFEKIKSRIDHDDRLLIIGNPPWVNNSILSPLGSENLPIKSNFKGLKGLDAITGSSNFDICEYMLLQLVEAFKNTNTIIAILCKTIVARNTFQELKRDNINFNICQMVVFDSKKVFNISADACLFIIGFTNSSISLDVCDVYDIESPQVTKYSFGYKNKKFYSSIVKDDVDIDGFCCFKWRQGIKHDCAKVMELKKTEKGYLNGYNDTIEIEDTIIYPLVKSSHIKTAIIKEFKKYVIVTQRKVKEDTSYISSIAPNTWNYLHDNIEIFRNRKSSIYKNSPEFSMFGIGDYSYSKYKVAISGFYKVPLFALLCNEKPIMVDDTCYFLNFNTYNEAYVAMLILNSELVQGFLKNIAFLDSKRPYTKKVLERIDFEKIILYIRYEDLVATEMKLKLTPHLTSLMLMKFISIINNQKNQKL